MSTGHATATHCGGRIIGGMPLPIMPGGIIGMPGGGIPGGIPGGMLGMTGGMTRDLGAPPAGSPGALGGGIICAGAGPPTPRVGPLSPADAGASGTPRPATCPRPMPGVFWSFFGADGGGASGMIAMTDSPRSTTKPSVRFVSFSSSPLPYVLIFRNSSQSAITRFMNLSKAISVPTNTRVSEIETRTR
eukprot:NODE_14059_length_1131_cov_3.285857.p2 GENE.NODE_14059_length_1131_cov_3.285857~~NODE_14059_length_1131_cov_3.285857.p2  ORF type:complete len:189 (+),score=43.39 NODE_14059_length_1131_cov_3.285857:400-966(+)